jgi:hypothetical protein
MSMVSCGRRAGLNKQSCRWRMPLRQCKGPLQGSADCLETASSKQYALAGVSALQSLVEIHAGEVEDLGASARYKKPTSLAKLVRRLVFRWRVADLMQANLIRGNLSRI